MPALTHSAKVKIAKRLQTHAELLNHKPLFETKGWEKRKLKIERQVAKIEKTRKLKAAEKKLNKEIK